MRVVGEGRLVIVHSSPQATRRSDGDGARSREAGYGVNRDHTAVGVWGFRVPLRDRAGAVFGAVNVAAPAAAFDRVDIDDLAATRREEARPIERAAPAPEADPGREPARRPAT